MDTMLKVSQSANAGENFFLLMGDFLEEYYLAPRSERIQMTAEPPEEMERKELIPYMAAAAHKLCNDSHLPAPPWTFEKRCFLPGGSPYFGGKVIGGLRLIFLYMSPPEFKFRNLFVSRDELTRV